MELIYLFKRNRRDFVTFEIYYAKTPKNFELEKLVVSIFNYVISSESSTVDRVF